MRFYNMKCENEECLHVEEDLIAESYDKIPKTKKCPKCGSKMNRVWEFGSIQIPDHMRAVTTTKGNKNFRERFNNKRPKRFY